MSVSTDSSYPHSAMVSLEQQPVGDTHLHDFAADVRRGLGASPKSLRCRWLYDRTGSLLFEEICAQPEYYIPRAETEILAAHADAIVAAVPAAAAIVELGSGSATKTRLILEASLRRTPQRVRYVPIDISASMLAESSRLLAAEYPRLQIHGLAATYEEGLLQLPVGPRLLLWLGSNVGNFARPEAARFLAEIARRIGPKDRLLFGVDLRKARALLERAYDDAAGVTERFNKNLLVRINRELGGQFDVDDFAHRASYDEAEGRVSMHLVSARRHQVRIAALGQSVAFEAGEAIHTEDSYKYSPDELDALCATAGLVVTTRFTDSEGRFASLLVAPA